MSRKPQRRLSSLKSRSRDSCDLRSAAQFFRSTDGRLFARVPVENRSEVYELRSGAFRDWLIGGYFRECQKLPTNNSVRRVLGAPRRLHGLMGARRPFSFVLAPVRAEETAIRSITLTSAIQVGRRSRSGLQDGLWSEGPACSSRGRGDSCRCRCLLAEGRSSCFGRMSICAIAIFGFWSSGWLPRCGLPAPTQFWRSYGEQGSAKSTLAKIVRLLIDPQSAPCSPSLAALAT